MANVQLVRQRNVQRQTATTTKVSQVQSLQLVQTMLHGALSMMTYLREFFPEKAYTERCYQMREAVLPYEDFAAARMPSERTDPDAFSTRVPILLRERSRRADLFLDWLEQDVFPEIERGELRAVQAIVHPDQKRREEVLEMYTFTVHYITTQNGQRQPSGVTSRSSNRPEATIEHMNVALQELLRSVSSVCDELPTLPARRYLSMKVHYNDEQSTKGGKRKRAKGFVVDNSDSLVFPEAEGWQTSTRSVDFASGYHNTNFKITALQQSEITDQSQKRQLPNNIKFSKRVSAYNDILLMPPPPLPAHANVSRKRGASEHELSAKTDINQAKRLATPSYDAESQASLVHNMMGNLDNMMQPEKLTQGDTQTQNTSYQLDFEDAVTVTPTTMRPSPSTSGRLRSPVSKNMYPLLSDTQQDIARRQPYLIKTANALAQKAGGSTVSGQNVLCQCGFGREEGDMVQCSSCSTWQHLHCYGYTGSEDPRLPDEHVCYWCLLGDAEADKYTALQQLAVQRRAMFYISKSGMRTRADLSKALGIEHKQASDLFAKIKSSSFVTQAFKSHKPGYRATGKALFVPVQDVATLRKLLETYFDPMTHISNHYDDSPAVNLAEAALRTNMRLLVAMAADLPPPSTPHNSRLRSVPRSTPSNSALSRAPSVPVQDWTTSETLLPAPAPSPSPATPIVSTRRQTQLSKRPLDMQEAQTSAPKRMATPPTTQRQYTSLRSLKIIDADGRSSPP